MPSGTRLWRARTYVLVLGLQRYACSTSATVVVTCGVGNEDRQDERKMTMDSTGEKVRRKCCPLIALCPPTTSRTLNLSRDPSG
jgi:hypothetical protein